MEPSRRELLGGALGLSGALAGAQAFAQESSLDTSPGEHVLEHGLGNLRVGCATDARGPTGATVLHFPKRALVVSDLRGGSPVVSGPDVVRDRGGRLDAICLAGGSLYGLAAADGVARALFEARERKTDWESIALVSGAVIYDFGLRETSIVPDGAFGRAALKAARPARVPLGARGAGAGATVGKWFPKLQPEWAGQGAAYRARGKSRVLVLSIVNALGAITDRKGNVVRGHKDPRSGKRYQVEEGTIGGSAAKPPEGNTTLTVVLVDRALSAAELRQLGREVHASMARAIHPFHGRSDGDVLYAVSCGQERDSGLNLYQLAALASECAWDAVLSCWRGR